MKMRVEGPLDFMPWERAYGLLAKVYMHSTYIDIQIDR